MHATVPHRWGNAPCFHFQSAVPVHRVQEFCRTTLGSFKNALDRLKLIGMTNTSRLSSRKKSTPAHDDESLPEGWQNATDSDGTEYFWNTATDQTTYQRPDHAASADVDSAKLAFDHSPAKGAALAFLEINNADGGPSTSAPPPGASMETAGRPSWQRNLFARKKAMAEPDLASGPTSGYWPPKRPVAPDALRNGFKQVLMTNAVLTRVGVPTKPPPPPTMASRMHDFHQQYDPTFDVALWQWQQGKWVHLPGEAVKSEAPREHYQLKPAGDAAGAGGTPAYWEAEVRRLFETADTDGDGVISSAVCRAALEARGLTKAQVASFMAECRNSPINEVRLEEMLIAFGVHAHGLRLPPSSGATGRDAARDGCAAQRPRGPEEGIRLCHGRSIYEEEPSHSCSTPRVAKLCGTRRPCRENGRPSCRGG